MSDRQLLKLAAKAAKRFPEGWPSEEWIQQACLDDCLRKYDSYDEWWENHTTGISSLIRKLFIEDYLGRKVSWEEYGSAHGA